MDIELIKKVIKLAEDSSISGLCIEQGDLKIEVKKESVVHSIPVPVSPVHHVAAAATKTQTTPDSVDEDADLSAIISPNW